MVFLHMISLYLDRYAHFSIADLLVPFHSTYVKAANLGKWPVALGVFCFYIMITVYLTSLMLQKLPRTVWKAIHYSSYALVLIVSFHAGWTGTDVRALVYRIVALTLIALTTLALIVRIIFPRPAKSLAARVEGRRPNKLHGNVHKLVVKQLNFIADDVLEIKFSRKDEKPLPAWQPGSHITLHLPNGLQRQYSLCGNPDDRNIYTIAVLRVKESRGGSSWLHEQIHVGMQVEVTEPNNHFELEPAPEYVFIAGGIGITPIKAMIASLPPSSQWRLIYAGRTRASMAYVDELASEYGHRVQVHADDVQGGRIDLARHLHDYQGHVYVCGPEPMLENLAQIVPSQRLHFERFVALDRRSQVEKQPFEVVLARSKVEFTVEGDESLLDAIIKHGGALLSSCGEGVCGTCEVRVLRGNPVHLDSVMSDEEKDDLGVMYPCVSRAKSGELILDI